jgi:Ca-activated chloride channel family protein
MMAEIDTYQRSTHTRYNSSSQAWFGLTIAIIAFAACFFLWSNANAETPPEPPATSDAMVRLSEINEGALLLKTVDHGVYIPAPLVATDVTLDVSGPIVRAIITQRFENPSDAWVEGTYVFPLPEDSGVDRLRMQIGDRFIEGEIHERQEARRIYEEARAQGQRASLMEQERPNMFTTSVANIGPGETVIVQIEYQDVARLNNGSFELRVPLAVTPRYIPQASDFLLVSTDSRNDDGVADAHRITPPMMLPEGEPDDTLRLPVSISIDLKPGFELGEVGSRFHSTIVDRSSADQARITLADGPIPANRDFVLSWRPANESIPSAALFTEQWNGDTYLLAQIVPPASLGADIPRRPRETIFVIDNSGSMSGASMRQAREALIWALERLEPTDRFNLIRFDNTMEQVFPSAVDATKANVDRALAFTRRLDAEGGTEMLPALRAALVDHTPNDRDHVRQVVFLTDGAIGNEAALFAAIDHGIGRSRLFPVGIGSAPNTYFMSRAARMGRGTFTHIGQVSDVAEQMEILFTALERPVMTNLDALFPQDALAEIWPAMMPDLYYGEPVTLTARLDRAEGAMIIEGELAGSRWHQQLSLADTQSASGVVTLWARNRIRSLEETRFQGADQASIDQAVLRTALDFHLVSRLTSLVAVDATPARPVNETLIDRDVPLMVPDGWDFAAVSEQDDARVQHASLDAELLARLRPSQAPGSAPVDEDGVALPATATPRGLLMLLGLILMLAALIWMVTHQERRLW